MPLSQVLHLGDGGLKQNLPIYPFITPARKADIIITTDASAYQSAPNPYSSYDGTLTASNCEVCAGDELDCPTVGASFSYATYSGMVSHASATSHSAAYVKAMLFVVTTDQPVAIFFNLRQIPDRHLVVTPNAGKFT